MLTRERRGVRSGSVPPARSPSPVLDPREDKRGPCTGQGASQPEGLRPPQHPPGKRETGNNEGWHRLDIPLGTERTKRLQQFVGHFPSRKLSVIQHTNQQIAGLEVSRKVIRKRADCL